MSTDPSKWIDALNRLGENYRGILKGFLVASSFLFVCSTAIIIANGWYPKILQLKDLPKGFLSITWAISISSGVGAIFSAALLLIPLAYWRVVSSWNTPSRVFKNLPLSEQCICMSFLKANSRDQRLFNDYVEVVSLFQKGILEPRVNRISTTSTYYLDEHFYLALAPQLSEFLEKHQDSEDFKKAIQMAARAYAGEASWLIA